MRLTLTGLVRMTAFLALGLGVMGVGVARVVPREVQLRRLAPPSAVPVIAYACGLSEPAMRLLEPATGRLVWVKPSDGGVLDQASLAPWRDESGGTQLVGRWIRRDGDGPSATGWEAGLARLAFPSGQVLNCVATDVLPTGPTCWMPGTSARVLFGAGDGRLYRFDFEAPDESPDPLPLAWEVAEPAPARVRLGDPTWPSDRRLAGRLLVAVNVLNPSGGQPTYRPSQVWWIQLDASRSAIVAAGPITGDGPDTHRRFPTLAPDGRGGLTLLSFVRHEGDTGWSLMSEPLALAPKTGIPTVALGTGQVLATDLCPTPPAVAADGSAVMVMARGKPEARPLRIALPYQGHDAFAHEATASSSESRRQPLPTTTGGSSHRTFGTTRGT